MAISDPAGRGRGVEMPSGHRGKVAIAPLVHPGIRFYLLMALDFYHQWYILALHWIERVFYKPLDKEDRTIYNGHISSEQRTDFAK